MSSDPGSQVGVILMLGNVLAHMRCSKKQKSKVGAQ